MTHHPRSSPRRSPDGDHHDADHDKEDGGHYDSDQDKEDGDHDKEDSDHEKEDGGHDNGAGKNITSILLFYQEFSSDLYNISLMTSSSKSTQLLSCLYSLVCFLFFFVLKHL